ncbi:MAG: S4 domain-containing protein [Blautia sp.]
MSRACLRRELRIAYPGKKYYNKTMSIDKIRLNKYLSEAGVCSRREADRLIQEGKVTVDGRIALMGERVSESQRIWVNHRPVEREERRVLLLLNKPRGVICTAKNQKNNIVEFVNYPIRVYPVGRLDVDSQGLILLTNQGDLVNKIMRAGNYHEKE